MGLRPVVNDSGMLNGPKASGQCTRIFEWAKGQWSMHQECKMAKGQRSKTPNYYMGQRPEGFLSHPCVIFSFFIWSVILACLIFLNFHFSSLSFLLCSLVSRFIYFFFELIYLLVFLFSHPTCFLYLVAIFFLVILIFSLFVFHFFVFFMLLSFKLFTRLSFFVAYSR